MLGRLVGGAAGHRVEWIDNTAATITAHHRNALIVWVFMGVIIAIFHSASIGLVLVPMRRPDSALEPGGTFARGRVPAAVAEGIHP